MINCMSPYGNNRLQLQSVEIVVEHPNRIEPCDN